MLRRERRLWFALPLVALPLVALAVTGCTAPHGEEPSPASSGQPRPPGAASPSPTGGATPRELVAALGEPQRPGDVLPSLPGGTAPDLDVVASSTRYLGRTSRAQYWVALEEEDDVCLVDALGGDAELMSTTCTAPEDFADGGISATLSASGTSATAYLVPQGFTVADAGTDENWVFVADNLLAPAEQV